MGHIIAADAGSVANLLDQAHMSALAYHLLAEHFVVDFSYSEGQVFLKYKLGCIEYAPFLLG